MNFSNGSNLMGTVDISKSKGGRFCCSYFYAKFSQNAENPGIYPGLLQIKQGGCPYSWSAISSHPEGLTGCCLLMTAVKAVVCSWHYDTTPATVVFFWEKTIKLPSFRKQKEKHIKNIPLELNSTGILSFLQKLNSERYIYFFFFIFEIWAGRCPPAAVHLQDALT